MESIELSLIIKLFACCLCIICSSIYRFMYTYLIMMQNDVKWNKKNIQCSQGRTPNTSTPRSSRKLDISSTLSNVFFTTLTHRRCRDDVGADKINSEYMIKIIGKPCCYRFLTISQHLHHPSIKSVTKCEGASSNCFLWISSSSIWRPDYITMWDFHFKSDSQFVSCFPTNNLARSHCCSKI